MKNKIPTPIELAILFFSTWQASNIFVFFRGTHVMERYTWAAFLIWIIPIVYNRSKSNSTQLTNPILLGAALVASVLGMLGSLNALCYLGFALALSALVPMSWFHLILIPSSIAWMSAFGYFAKGFFPQQVLLGRIIIVILSTLIFFIPRISFSKEVEDETI